MARDSDQEMVDLMDGMADEIREEDPPSALRRPRGTNGGRGPNRSLLIGGAIVLVVLIIFIVVLSGGQDLSPEDLKAIQGRISQLEDRMTRVEGMMDRVPDFGKQMEGIRKDIDGMQTALKGLKTEINRTNKQMAGLRKKSDSSGGVSKTGAKRYHTVRSGDSLFSIAKKYGLTINDLRRLNSKLDKSGKIMPGQKILVGPL